MVTESDSEFAYLYLEEGPDNEFHRRAKDLYPSDIRSDMRVRIKIELNYAKHFVKNDLLFFNETLLDENINPPFWLDTKFKYKAFSGSGYKVIKRCWIVEEARDENFNLLDSLNFVLCLHARCIDLMRQFD